MRKRRPEGYWSEIKRRQLHRAKIVVLQRYGDRCAFCGETRYELLVVDHVKGGGRAHRKTPEFIATGGMFRFLAKYRYYRPDRYRILCFNCNAARQFFGIEPGKKKYQPLKWWANYANLKCRDCCLIKPRRS